MADEPVQPEVPPVAPPPSPSKRRGTLRSLQTVFLVMSFFGLFFLLLGPPASEEQATFRNIVVLFAWAGFVVVTVLKWTKASGD